MSKVVAESVRGKAGPSGGPLIASPIVVLAAPRSGSSTLFACLSAHPEVWSLYTEAKRVFDGVLRPEGGGSTGRASPGITAAAPASVLGPPPQIMPPGGPPREPWARGRASHTRAIRRRTLVEMPGCCKSCALRTCC